MGMGLRQDGQYPLGMQLIPMPHRGQILVVVTPHVGGEAVFDLAARLALAGHLEVIDGGNTFNAYRAVEALRRNAPRLPGGPAGALERVRLARAFTCYQLAALLEALETAPLPDETGQPPQGEMPWLEKDCPLLILDLLATFGDQSVAIRERRRLLGACLAGLKRLALTGRQVGIWLRAHPVAQEEVFEFQARVEQTAGRVWRFDYLPTPGPVQGRLF